MSGARAIPIVVVGGVIAFMNPAPMTPFVDAFAVGEGEEIVGPAFRTLVESRGRSRTDRIGALAGSLGMYVPAIHGVGSTATPVERRWSRDARAYVGEEAPEGPFGGSFLIEVGRGCGHACRFCAAGSAYLPVRRVAPDAILSATADLPEGSRVGLVGTAISDHPRFSEICIELAARGYKLGTSSFRADAVADPSLVAALVSGGMRTVTIAPEGGSERMRRIVGKNLTEEEILLAARTTGAGGIESLKLYFMYGFPGENDDDLAAISNLVRRVRDTFREAGGREVSVSANALVPKPNTPFQFAAMPREEELRRRLAVIEKGLRGLPIRVQGLAPREAIVQAVLSIGGAEVGAAIRMVAEEGIPWKAAFKRTGVDLDALLHREKALDEPFPWDFIHQPPGRDRLAREYRAAMDEAE